MAAVKLGIRRKIALILGLFLFAFSLVVIKLAIVQFIQGEDLQAKADELRTRDMAVDASRGTIYDRNGSKLAISITADSVAVRPPEINSLDADEREIEADKTARALADILDKDYQWVYDQVTSDQYYVYIQRKIDFELAEQIREADLTGVEIEEETQRYYPKGTLAAHVLGYAGVDNQGLSGIEYQLDDLLTGQDGRIVGEYDANNNPIPQAEYEYVAPEDGYDVYLTIDENIQYFCERELANLMESEYPPKNAGIIIMDPDNGEILAMAVANTYDPNNYDEYDESSRRNFLVSDSYEPGSTFKMVTASIALEEGTVNENSSFYCPGYVMVAGSRINCWDSGHGTQNLAEAVQNSCNPAFVAIGQSIEAKQDGLFYKYINAFGFGQTTGIELNGEATGILQDEESVNQVEIATIAMGQGIAVTPIQMITAASAIANDGVLLKPTLVSKIMDGDTVVYEHEKEEVRRVISEETAQKVREMLVGVVTDGSGTKAAIEGYTIGGKTGTAQKASESGGYAPGKYVASFIGMVPADDPELVCLVVVDEPSGVYFGSQVAAPIFKAVMSDTLSYLGIPPSADANDGIDESTNSSTDTVPGVVNYSVAEAISQLQDSGFNVKLTGSGNTVTSQQPAGGETAKSGSTVLLTAEGSDENGEGMVTVPDLRGMRFAETANVLSVLGLTLSAEGSGVAYSQSPDYGAVVPSGTAITVKFKDDGTIDSGIKP